MELSDQIQTTQCVVSKTNPALNKSLTPSANLKVLSQQVFHPGLFNRTRSSSVCETSKNQEATVNIASQSILTTTQRLPPDWQRVPTSKKRKCETSPQSEKDLTPTTNRFKALPLDSDDNTPVVPLTNKPPPIILYGIEDVNKLTNLIETVSNRRHFMLKIVNKNLLRILADTTEEYKKIISLIRENGLIGHTFTRKDTKCYRFVIKISITPLLIALLPRRWKQPVTK